jgi:hypothetical protein
MPEFGHHLQWMTGVLRDIEAAERSRVALGNDIVERLRQGRAVCEQVLGQNPGSALARSARGRIDALLAGGAPLAPAESTEERVITREDGEKMERIILGVETGMARMRAMLEEQMRSHQGPSLGALFVPFSLVDRNRSNPFKNFPRHWLDMHEGRTSASYSIGYGQYSYDIVPERFAREREDVFGHYDAQHNLVRMPEGFDPSCLFELILLYHEILHVAQSHALRARMGDEAYSRFRDGSKKILLPHEVEAYAVQFEMMDRLLGGWPRAGAAEGDSPKRLERLMAQTNGKEKHRWLAANMLQAMRVFYPYGWRDDCYPPCNREFHDALKRSYAREGKLYIYDAQGLPVPLP